jgi:hypothetical protein
LGEKAKKGNRTKEERSKMFRVKARPGKNGKKEERSQIKKK